MTAMSDREVYPYAPVVLVALELRHPTAEPLSRAAQVKIKQLLGKGLPLPRQATMTNIQATLGAVQPEVTTETAPQYVSRDRTMAVTFRSGAVIVETTRYARYERFREIVALAVEARQAVEPVAGIERLGLRYINEIRVPDVGDTLASWEPWVDRTLLGPAPVVDRLGFIAAQLQGVMILDGGDGKAIALRYGPRGGYAVDPEGSLKRPTPAPGPFFLLDIDSFWMPTDDVPEFDPKQLLTLGDELHEPVRTLFENLITERLREEVLRDAG
jgi:uncharacterized protein (TIGR04255 family)